MAREPIRLDWKGGVWVSGGGKRYALPVYASAFLGGRVADAVGKSSVACRAVSILQERRMLFDIYIGTLFTKSRSSYDAVHDWVKSLVERGAE